MSKKAKTDLGALSLKDILDLKKLNIEQPDNAELEKYASSHVYDIKNIPAEADSVLYLQELEIGSKGNIVSITGRSKSRKTVIASAIVSAMLAESNNFLTFSSAVPKVDKILHLDTEQGYGHFYKAVGRMLHDAKLKEPPARLVSHWSRDADVEFRVSFIEYLIQTHKPGVFILDGVTDCVVDINSQEEAARLGQKLLTWSSVYNCLIICVIHVTKSTGYMTGAVGTWLEKKSETVIKVEVPDDNIWISNVSCQYSRNKPFAPFTIQYNDSLEQYEVTPESEVTTKGKGAKKDPELYNDQIHAEVLQKIFLYSSMIKDDEIAQKIRHFVKDTTKDEISKPVSEKFKRYYSERAWIFCGPDNNWRRMDPPKAREAMLPFAGQIGDQKPPESDDLPF